MSFLWGDSALVVYAICLSINLIQLEVPNLRHAGEAGCGVRDGGDAGEQLLVVVSSQIDETALVFVVPHQETVLCVERLDCRLDLGVGSVVTESLPNNATLLGLVASAKTNEIAVVDANAVKPVGEEAAVHWVVDDEFSLRDYRLSAELVKKESLAIVQGL